MNSQPDLTILWCLEQLATECLNDDVLLGLITHVSETRGSEVMEETLKVRLLLAGFSARTEISVDTLEDLQKISSLLNQTEDEFLVEKRDHLLPPPELMTLVKTELVAQGWRNSVKVTSRELTALLRANFGQQPEAHEKKRFDELQKATTLPGFRAHIDRLLDGNTALSGLVRYAFEAQLEMGPTLLEVINDDINAGRYIPGQQMPEPQSAMPSPASAPPSAAPASAPPASAPPAARQTTAQPTPVANTALNQILEQMRNAAGNDPAQNFNAETQMMLAAAALASAAFTSITPGRPASVNPPAAVPRAVPEAQRRVVAIEAAAAPARRQNQRWTPGEVQRLIEACEKHGPGAWSQIEADNRDLWGPAPGGDGTEYYRTQVDLKDKWRNLLKSNNPEAIAVKEMWDDKRRQENTRPAPPPEDAMEVEKDESEMPDTVQEDGVEEEGDEEEEEKEESESENETSNQRVTRGRANNKNNKSAATARKTIQKKPAAKGGRRKR
jgi:hypothetical protein